SPGRAIATPGLIGLKVGSTRLKLQEPPAVAIALPGLIGLKDILLANAFYWPEKVAIALPGLIGLKAAPLGSKSRKIERCDRPSGSDLGESFRTAFCELFGEAAIALLMLIELKGDSP
ncbi:MAG: hypothetical protein F6K28_32915, partial [Microcoleus sp. SIO2G3]|nr:hypothetical protein [Microcoleus sp. SIO2G3]